MLTLIVKHWWVYVVRGLLAIAFGVMALIGPGLTAVVLLICIALWAILTGVLKIAAAVQLRKEIEGEWILPWQAWRPCLSALS